MLFKRLLMVTILGFGLLSFGTLSQAAESISSADEEVTHSHHTEGTVHSLGEEGQATDIQPMYDPCPVAGGLHIMYYMSEQTHNGGNTGTPHYHGNHYCQPYIVITTTLYSCINCGYDEWRTSSKTIHPGL